MPLCKSRVLCFSFAGRGCLVLHIIYGGRWLCAVMLSAGVGVLSSFGCLSLAKRVLETESSCS